MTYREYVRTQREKDAGVYSVKAAMQRANFMDQAEPGWISILKLHYGAFATLEAMAASAESRMARFGKAGGMRNMATFGSLDENRHGQIQLYFPHEHVQRSRQFDWAAKSMHTNEWAVVAARHLFDDIMSGRDAIGVAIMLTFAFETGFSNLQFLGLAADAAKAGDISFSNLASSIQTDEARHAQIGGRAERAWLEEKYPGWEDTWGSHFWDPIIDRFVKDGPVDTVLPAMVQLCNMAQVPITGTPGWAPGKTGRPLKDYPLEYEGRTYHFGSEVDRWIFEQEPERYKDHLSVADRMVAGMIQPPTLDGLLEYFNLRQGEQGNDALNHSWIEEYRQPRTKAA